MANTIKIKRSAVPGKVPTVGDLQLSELAVNTYDGKLFLKKDNGTQTIVEIGASSGGSTTFTASSSAPSSPMAGDEWFDIDNGILYTYVNDGTSSQWVELGAPGLVGSGGAGVTDGDKGDITVSGSGSTWTIDNGVVGTAKLGGDITTAGKALLDDADAAAQRTTLGLGTLATQSGAFSGTSSGTNTGDQNLFSTIAVAGQSNIVADAASDTLTLVAGSNVTITTDAATDTVTIAASGGGGVSDGDKGDITVSGSGTTWTVDANAITNAKLAEVATGTFKGRATAGTGNVEDLTAAQATAGLNTFTSSLKGLAPASGGGTTNFLRADGTWAAPPTGGGGGVLRVTMFAGNSVTWTNMPAAATIFAGNTSYIQKANLTNYTECRLLVNKTGVAGQAGAILELEYSTTYTQTAASYSQIGTTAASVGVAVADQYLDSGWKTLAAGAKADVFLTVIGTGGNGTLDPTFGHIIAEFR